MSDKPQTQTKKTKLQKNSGVISERDMLIIDEYYNNFFNKSKAVQSVVKVLKHQSQANHIFNGIIKKPEVKKYIETKQLEQQQSTGITPIDVIKERLNIVSTDITQLIGLSEEELKDLPDSVKRSIQSYKITEREETDRKGNRIKTKNIDCKLIDKNDSLKEIAKLIGAYGEHNKQKSNVLDLSKANDQDFKQLMQVFKSISANNSDNNTIDI